MIQASPGVLRQRSTRRSQRPVPGTLVGGNPHAGHSSLVIVISSDTLRGGEVKRSAAASDQPPPRALPHPHVGNPACHGSWLASGSGLQFPSPHKSRARVDASAGPKPQPSHTTAPSPLPSPLLRRTWARPAGRRRCSNSSRRPSRGRRWWPQRPAAAPTSSPASGTQTARWQSAAGQCQRKPAWRHRWTARMGCVRR